MSTRCSPASGISRRYSSDSYNCWRTVKKKRKADAGWWDRHREQFARTDRLLRERIAYHDAKLREEHPGWTPPQTTDEWIAYYEAKWAAARAARGDSQ
jgi:hypothetical protein